jgi:hypothetical protein
MLLGKSIGSGAGYHLTSENLVYRFIAADPFPMFIAAAVIPGSRSTSLFG